MACTCTYFPLECTVKVWQMALIDTTFRRVYFHLQEKWKEWERNAGERRVYTTESNNSTHVPTLCTATHMYFLRLQYTPYYATVYCRKVVEINNLRAWYRASTALQMTFPHFWGVTQLSLVVNDLSVQPFVSFLKGKLVCPETWVRIWHFAQRNISEERISLRFMCPWLQYIPPSLTIKIFFPHCICTSIWRYNKQRIYPWKTCTDLTHIIRLQFVGLKHLDTKQQYYCRTVVCYAAGCVFLLIIQNRMTLRILIIPHPSIWQCWMVWTHGCELVRITDLMKLKLKPYVLCYTVAISFGWWPQRIRGFVWPHNIRYLILL